MVMRKLLTIILLALFAGDSYVIGQVSSSDMPPAAMPTFWWRCGAGDSVLNFNNVISFGRRDSLVFDSLPYAKEYTMVVVYKAADSMEATVWRMEYTDSAINSTRGLTTERIISDRTTIRYAGRTVTSPIINTLRQTAPDSASPYVRLVTGNDTLRGNVMVAEIMYFDKRLGTTMLRRVQSALAIRYGVTLGPVDYVAGNGDPIWKYADGRRYHHRITGLGRDSTYNLLQFRSCSEIDGAVLTIATDTLGEGSFLLVGDNDAPLYFEQDTTDVEILGRQWHVQATGVDGNRFSLGFDTRDLPLPTDSLVLLMDGYIVLPSSITSNEVRFDNVLLPSDTCTLALARGPVLWQVAKNNAPDAKGGARANNTEDSKYGTTPTTFNVFPNPTTGRYTVEVSGARQVQVSIYNMYGVEVEAFSDSEREHYVFSGNLPSGNSYYATVTTESGSQTMKLVVK